MVTYAIIHWCWLCKLKLKKKNNVLPILQFLLLKPNGFHRHKDPYARALGWTLTARQILLKNLYIFIGYKSIKI